mmetsp:Transcript_16966/g.43599  ORF Transcript_16966/g.43599 Transcript_16966/m.43599 type:complete len:240 (+) Transcript_16966:283-1002(+)
MTSPNWLPLSRWHVVIALRDCRQITRCLALWALALDAQRFRLPVEDGLGALSALPLLPSVLRVSCLVQGRRWPRLRLTGQRADDAPREMRILMQTVFVKPCNEAALASDEVDRWRLPSLQLRLFESKLDLAQVDRAEGEGPQLRLLEVVAAIHHTGGVHAVPNPEEVAGLVAEYHPTAPQETRRRRLDVIRVPSKGEEPDTQVEVGLSEEEPKALDGVANIFHRVPYQDECILRLLGLH